MIVVLANVKAWKREKMVYGRRAIATGFEDHQNIASKKY